MTKRKLAVILFIDMVGYTALMQKNDQHASTLLRYFQNQLEEKVRNNNGRIVNSYGDGALCTFSIPIDAVRCAQQLQASFGHETKVPVRIGIHSGTVAEEKGKIFGDSVNIASRIESMGVAGSILLSKKLRDEVKNNPDLVMQPLGSFELKNVEESIEVYALANEGLRVPKKAEINAKLQKAFINKNLLVSLAALFLVLLAYLGYSSWQNNFGPLKRPGSIDAMASGDPSVAVLPFVNMNKDEEGDLFCDGMMEDILAHLAKLKNLKVISRTSAIQYKNTSKKSPEIASELGVTHLVEGSMRKYGDNARITVQLIRAPDDQRLWAEQYDRDLKDIFAVQTEVAQQIVQAFQVNISPVENNYLKASGTTNLEAYQLYIRGKRASDDRSIEQFEQGVALLKSAIALDSTFADAYSALSYNIFMQVTRDFIDRDTGLLRAEQLANKALDLDEDNVNALRTIGAVYHIRGDLSKKREMVEKTLALAPNDPDINHAAAFYYEAVGDFEQGLYYRKKAVELDPLLYVYHHNYINVLILTGRTAEARMQLAKVEQLFPEEILPSTRLKGRLALREGDFETAIRLLNGSGEIGWYIASLGYAYAKTGQLQKAREKIEQLSKTPEIDYYKDLAIIYIGMNQRDSAFHYLNLAVEQNLQNPKLFTRLADTGLVMYLKKVIPLEYYFDSIRSDARYKALLKKMEPLPDYRQSDR